MTVSFPTDRSWIPGIACPSPGGEHLAEHIRATMVAPHFHNEDAPVEKTHGRTAIAALRPTGSGHKCYACRKPLTVRIGTIFESSHLPLHLWLQRSI